jgi:hypothetical protein
MNPSLSEPHDAWMFALYAELALAVQRGQVDASHDIEADLNAFEAAGAEAYLETLYTDENERKTYDDTRLDRLSLEAEAAAHAYLSATRNAG